MRGQFSRRVRSPLPPAGLPPSVPPSGLHPYAWTGVPSPVHLWLRPFEPQARFTFPHVRPFATASPRLLRPRLTPRSASLASPFGA